MNNEDRRVKKTEKALYIALAELLLKKKIQNISIKELTDTADIHRSTFYTHYQDIYDLYEKLEDSVIKELGSMIVNDPTHNYEELYIRLINYVYSNSTICKMLFVGNGNLKFQRQINQLLEDSYLEIWMYEDKKNSITEEMRYFTAYHIQGCISILNLWMENNFNYPQKKVLNLLRILNEQIEKIMP